MLRNHIEKLHYFKTICDCGSLRRASEQLRISQSALSIALKRLEEVFDQSLLIRSARGIEPTQTGRMLYQFAQEIGRKVEEIELKLKNPEDPFAGKVRIGAYESIANYWLPQFVNATRQRYPKLHLEISIGSSLEICRQVGEGLVDVGIVIQSPKDESLRPSKLFDDGFSFFVSRTLQRRALSKLTTELPLIGMWTARIQPRKQLSDLLHDLGVALSHSIMVQSFEIARALAVQGLGIAVLPERVAQASLSAGQLSRLRGMPTNFGRHDIHMVLSADDSKRSVVMEGLKELAIGLS